MVEEAVSVLMAVLSPPSVEAQSVSASHPDSPVVGTVNITEACRDIASPSPFSSIENVTNLKHSLNFDEKN